MGFGRFMLSLASLEKLAKAAKDASVEFNIPLDESILTNKEKVLDWLDNKENKKLFQQNKKKEKASKSINDDVNPSNGLPMIDGCIDVGGNSYGSK